MMYYYLSPENTPSNLIKEAFFIFNEMYNGVNRHGASIERPREHFMWAIHDIYMKKNDLSYGACLRLLGVHIFRPKSVSFKEAIIDLKPPFGLDGHGDILFFQKSVEDLMWMWITENPKKVEELLEEYIMVEEL